MAPPNNRRLRDVRPMEAHREQDGLTYEPPPKPVKEPFRLDQHQKHRAVARRRHEYRAFVKGGWVVICVHWYVRCQCGQWLVYRQEGLIFDEVDATDDIQDVRDHLGSVAESLPLDPPTFVQVNR